VINPFELHGTDFLAFYVVVGAIAVGLEYLWIRALEAGPLPPLQLTDPYQIAYLRGGAEEALKIVALSLIDRGLLKAGDGTLGAEENAHEWVRRRIEKAVLRLYRLPGEVTAMAADADCQEACRSYRETLDSHGLIAGAGVLWRRLPGFLLAAMLLVFVGMLKINIALSEGRDNLAFLIACMVGFGYATLHMFRRHQTRRGEAMLADLRAIFSRLRGRSETLRQGGATNEAALLAAVFGVSAVPRDLFPGLRGLYPKRKKRSDSGCGSGSGSSCSSSCGSSCSSCGGGCGGGCGG
jgi:uncharacterized protein (TIGR04222 family)